MKKFYYIKIIFFMLGIVYSCNITKARRNLKNRKGTKIIKKDKLKKNQTNIKKQTEEISNNTNKNSLIKKEKLSCSEKYNLCMDSICKDENEIRYICNSSIDSFETVIRDNEKVRIGNDLYTLASGACEITLNNCKLSERNHITTAYKIQIQNDLLTKNYIEAMKAQSDETVKEVLEEYTNCMAPLCGSYFSECFSIKAIERRTENCNNILSKTTKPLSVKKMFYEKIFKQRKEFCNLMSGSIDYDTKICKIPITYGTPEKIEKWENGVDKSYYTGKIANPVITKDFNYGEIVQCTQEYFSVDNVNRPNIAQGIKDIFFGSLKAIGGICLMGVGGAVAAGTLGADSVHATGMILNGVGMTCNATAQLLNGATKFSEQKVGGCFINGDLVAEMNTYFKVTIAQ